MRTILTAIGVLLCLAPPARAEQKTRVTVFLLPSRDISAKTVASFSNQLRDALRRNKRLQVKDWNKLLAEFAGDVPSEDLLRADGELKAGLTLLDGGNAEEAAARLQGAIAQFRKLLGFVKKATLADAQLALGVAQARMGRARAAKKTFTNLLIWRPTARFDTTRFGTDLLPLFEQGRRVAEKRKRGSVELKTVPAGAKAYVDGRFMGVTPTVAFGLPVGQHFATFKKEGFIKSGEPIEVDPRMQLSVEVPLRRSEKYLLLRQALEKAKDGLGQQRANTAMTDLRSVLFVDQLLFTRLEEAGAAGLSVQAYLYDLRSQLRLSEATLTMRRDATSEAHRVANALYLNVPYDGSIPAPPEPPPPPPEKRSAFYAKWWFWTAVAAGAAAVTLTAVFWPTDDGCQANVDGNLRCFGLSN